jgi:hypothetical protein
LGRWLGDFLAEVAARGRVQADLVEWLGDVDDSLGLFDVQLGGTVLEVQGDVADRALLV